MHREAIPDAVWTVLLGLTGLQSLRTAYLAGGTGLPLQLGHRVSFDLDFFLPVTIDYADVLTEISTFSKSVTVMSQTLGHCEVMIDGVKVDFIRERMPLQHSVQTLLLGRTTLNVAHPADIGHMKLMAIASRGSRKDFIDLYCLSRKVISLEDLLRQVTERQNGLRFNRLLFFKGLIDFDEAELDVPPVLPWEISWSQVKEELTRVVRSLAEGWSSQRLAGNACGAAFHSSVSEGMWFTPAADGATLPLSHARGVPDLPLSCAAFAALSGVGQVERG